jgi:protein TonB
MKYFNVMNKHHRFALAFFLTLCINVLLFAAVEFYFRFAKNDFYETAKSISVVQVVLGKTIRENISLSQTIQEEIILAEEQIVLQNEIPNEKIFSSQQNVDEVTETLIDQENISIDSSQNNFVENIISSSTTSSEIIADNNFFPSSESSIELAEAERNKLAEIIYALIEKEKQYPPLARRRNIEGQVDVMISVSSIGQLLTSSISSSSENSILDQAAINLIENIFPLNINLQSITTITVTITYSLMD